MDLDVYVRVQKHITGKQPLVNVKGSSDDGDCVDQVMVNNVSSW